MLEHVLGQHEVERLVRKRKGTTGVEVDELVRPAVVVQVGVEPTRPDVLSRTEVQLAKLVALEIAVDLPATPEDPEGPLRRSSHDRYPRTRPIRVARWNRA